MEQFDKVIINFKQEVENQDADEASIICASLDESIHKIIRRLANRDGVTVFDCHEKYLAKGFNDGSVDLFFTFETESKKNSTTTYSVLRSDEGKLEFTVGTLWELTGRKKHMSIEVKLRKKKVVTKLVL